MSPAARHARRPTGQAHTSPTAAALAPALRFMRPPRQEARAQPRRESAARAVTARRVLIVDDDAALRTLYRFNLEASGLMVDEAPDGETALRMLAEGELPDALLLDVMMPGIDGWTVAERLAADERTAKLPILFVTARAEDASRTRGAALGAAAYLTKPFNPVSLADEIERAIAESGRRG